MGPLTRSEPSTKTPTQPCTPLQSTRFPPRFGRSAIPFASTLVRRLSSSSPDRGDDDRDRRLDRLPCSNSSSRGLCPYLDPLGLTPFSSAAIDWRACCCHVSVCRSPVSKCPPVNMDRGDTLDRALDRELGRSVRRSGVSRTENRGESMRLDGQHPWGARLVETGRHQGSSAHRRPLRRDGPRSRSITTSLALRQAARWAGTERKAGPGKKRFLGL